MLYRGSASSFSMCRSDASSSFSCCLVVLRMAWLIACTHNRLFIRRWAEGEDALAGGTLMTIMIASPTPRDTRLTPYLLIDCMGFNMHLQVGFVYLL